jgi:hypothetical protein
MAVEPSTEPVAAEEAREGKKPGWFRRMMGGTA